jgi:hypothetical protein
MCKGDKRRERVKGPPPFQINLVSTTLMPGEGGTQEKEHPGKDRGDGEEEKGRRRSHLLQSQAQTLFTKGGGGGGMLAQQSDKDSNMDLF